MLLHLQSLIAFILNIYSMFNFLFYVKSPQFNSFLVYTLLAWNLLSMISQSPTIMMWATITLIYPVYLIDHARAVYTEIYFQQFTRTVVFYPLSQMQYFLVVFLASLHLGVTIMTNSENLETSALHKYIHREIARNEVNNAKFKSVIFKIYDIIRLRVNKLYRYIPILMAIFTALHSISVLNAFLLLFALFFMWNRRNDTKYWKWFNAYIIFIIIVKQFCNYNLQLKDYNIEFLAFFGLISIEEDINSNGIRGLMVFNFILLYFSAGWYKKLNKKITHMTLMQDVEDEEKLKAIAKMPIIKNLLKVYNLGAMIFQYYSIWIYHMGANVILLSDTRDLLNISLLIIESLIAFIHITIWNRRGEHPYKKVYWTWIISFYIVVFYVIARYMLYFMKYTTFVNILYSSLGTGNFDLDRHVFSSIRSISRNELNHATVFWSSFARPMLLLVLVVLTRETFLRMFRGDASFTPGLLKNSKNDLGQNEYEEHDQDGEGNVEDIKKIIGTIERRANPFVVLYLIFKGMFLGLVMSYLHSNMNVLKLTMIACYLMNMHWLFRDLIKLCEKMKLMELFTLRAHYFYYTFLTGKKWRKFGDENKISSVYTAESQKCDLKQNKFYYEQLLVGMEQILFKVNRIFWGLVFFPLLILSTTLIALNYVVRTEELVIKYKLNFFLGITSSKWLNQSEITSELIGIQLVISGLFLEYMLTSAYLDCKSTLKQGDQVVIHKLLDCIETKYRYLVDVRMKNISKERDEERLAEFQEALNHLPDHLETVPSERSMPTNGQTENHEAKDSNPELDIDKGNPSKLKDNSSEECSSANEHTSQHDSKEENNDQDNEDDEEEDNKGIAEGADFLTNVIHRHNKENPNKRQVYYMTELVSKEEMLLFLNKNRYKYYLMKILESSMYFLTRLGLFPLVYPICKQINVVNIGFLIFFIYQSRVPSRTFMQDAKEKGLFIFFYFFLQSVHEFFHSQMLEYPVYESIVRGSEIHFHYLLLMPVKGEYYAICFYWLLAICLGFALVPVFVWASIMFLFKEKLSNKNRFHFYLFDINRKRNIAIDFMKWRQSGLQFLHSIYKTAYTNAISIHSFVVILFSVFFWRDSYIVVFLFTLCISIYEHFKPDQAEQDLLYTGKVQYLKVVTRIYSYIYWAMIAFIQIVYFLGYIGFLAGFSKNREKYMTQYDYGVIILILMVLRGAFEDVSLSEDYKENSERLSSESLLKIRFANMCRAYDINEYKIYNRVVEMMRKRYIDEISNQVLDGNDIAKVKLDPNYSEKCIIEMIDRSSDEIKEKHVGIFRRSWLSMLETFYKFIIHKSNNYRYMDIMFLYQIIQARNKNILEQAEINLEDYFDQDLKMFRESSTKIKLFYSGLQDSDQDKMEIYSRKINEFLALDPFEKKDPQAYDGHDFQSGLFAMITGTSPAEQDQKQGEATHSKSRHSLMVAADILAKAVQHRLSEESIHSLDAYKLEFARCGFVKCNFGRMQVLLYNTHFDYLSETKGFNEFRLRIILGYTMRMLVANSEYIVSCALICIHIWVGGFSNILLIGIIVFTTFIEETLGRSFWWRILYCCYLFMTLIKQVYDSSAFLLRHEKIVIWAFGRLNKEAMIPDTLCILLVMYMIEFLKKYGVDNKSAIDFENPGQAIARLAVNNDFSNMVERLTAEDVRKKELFNNYLDSSLNFNNAIICKMDLKMMMVKVLIKNYTHLIQFTKEFIVSAQKLLKSVRFDVTRVRPQDLDSFFYRNFSHYLRKPGVDYNGISSAILIALIVYVLVLFPIMSSEKDTPIASFIVENKVTAFTVINFAIYLSFFILHYYLDQMKSNDTKGLNSKEYTITLIGDFDAPKKVTMNQTWFGFLQTIATKVKNAMIIGNFSKGNQVGKDYKNNPLLYLFLFSMFLWFYANLTVFIWHPFNTNFRASQKTGFYKFICEEKDKIGDLTELNKLPCKNYSENYLSMGFYLLNVMYLITCMLQIRGGKLLQITKITDFSKLGNLLHYKIYGALPLVRETRMTFEYCATHTSLLFTDFTLLKELEFLLYDAKIQHRSDMRKRTGLQLSRLVQNIFCIVVIIIVIILFVVPLYLFYNSNQDNFYEIRSATLSVDMLTNNNYVLNLFKVDKLKFNKPLLDHNPQKVEELVGRQSNLRRYPKKQFYVEVIYSVHRVQ
jgi:hypothetical protein